MRLLGGAALLALLSAGGGALWWRHRAATLAEAQAEHAQAAFQPALDKLEPAAPTYDIDQTVRVIHELDLALQQQRSLDGYLQYMARQDYQGVAPEVLEARRRVLAVLLPLYARQVEAEDQQAMWETTSTLMLSALSVVSVQGKAGLVGPSGSFSVDREQAQRVLADWQAREAERRDRVRDMAELETELYRVMIDYSEVYYRYVAEWDSLVVLRDRARLASMAEDWPATEAAATAALERAPKDKESPLLLAMAWIEAGGEERDPAIRDLLGRYIEDHPDATAPAFLLLGVNHAKRGRAAEARLAFQQSAAYYPRQAANLTDMLDPYKMRAYLKQSREGGLILEAYQSSMLGAGYYSPDLQMAKLDFDSGDFERGRQDVLDHFARRRQQGEWAFVIRDIQYCQDLLGPHFWEIFPEDSWLDLEVGKTLVGGELKVSVNNRSARTLRNGTLVLALHLTDMYPGEYTAIQVPRTQPAVPAHTVTDFGSVPIALGEPGREKSIGDIVEHRAILISDEAVSWVDTDAYKIAESQEFADARAAARSTGRAATAPPPSRLHPEFQPAAEQLLARAAREVGFETESRLGKDDILIELPRELAILRPVFRLRYGGAEMVATENLIEDDRIRLRFPGVDNFESLPDSRDVALEMETAFGTVTFAWTGGGQVGWTYQGLRR